MEIVLTSDGRITTEWFFQYILILALVFFYRWRAFLFPFLILLLCLLEWLVSCLAGVIVSDNIDEPFIADDVEPLRSFVSISLLPSDSLLLSAIFLNLITCRKRNFLCLKIRCSYVDIYLSLGRLHLQAHSLLPSKWLTISRIGVQLLWICDFSCQWCWLCCWLSICPILVWCSHTIECLPSSFPRMHRSDALSLRAFPVSEKA